MSSVRRGVVGVNDLDEPVKSGYHYVGMDEESSFAESESQEGCGLGWNPDEFFGGSIHKFKVRDGFERAQRLALQVAFWVMIFAGISVNLNRAKLGKMGFAPSSFLCTLLFAVGSDIGSTVQNVFYGTIGTFWAWFVNWIFVGFFPEGYNGENGGEWWAAMGLICAYTFLFLFLKVNGSVQFFALLNFTGGFAMNLVNPNKGPENFSGNFTISHMTAAENAFLVYLVGASLALLVFLLPPVTSQAMSQKRVVDVLKDLATCIKRLNTYYCQTEHSLVCHDIIEDFKTLRGRLAKAEAYGASSWFEYFGTDPRRTMTIKLIDTIKELMDSAEPILDVAAKEDFGESHNTMMKRLKQPLTDVIARTLQVFYILIITSSDGHVDEKEENLINEILVELEGLVQIVKAELQKATLDVLKDSKQYMSRDVMGEHFMVWTIVRMAKLVCERAKGISSTKHESWCGTFADSVRGLVKGDWADFKYALRVTACLMTNFTIGIAGWCNEDSLEYTGGDHRVCFLTQYTSGLAAINVVLLDRYGASTVKKAMFRVSAVVVANVVGQMAYVVFGSCNEISKMMTVGAAFLTTWGFMYFRYDGDETGLAQRVGAITVSSLMANCSDAAQTTASYSAKYHGLTDIVLGVMVMTIFDFLFGEESATDSAERKLKEAVQDFYHLLKKFLAGDGKPLTDEIAAIQDKLTQASGLFQAAQAEYHFKRPGFNDILCTEIAEAYAGLATEMLKLGAVTEDDKREILDLLPGFDRVQAELIFCAHETMKVATLSIDREPELSHEAEKRTIREANSAAMDTLVKGMNLRPFSKATTEKMEVDPVSRSCAAAQMIDSMLKNMRRLQRKCIQSKDKSPQ